MTSTVQTTVFPRVPSLRPDSGSLRRTMAPMDVFVAAFALLLVWGERIRQRQGLADMDERLLSDIGLTSAEAAAEYRKPFWRR